MQVRLITKIEIARLIFIFEEYAYMLKSLHLPCLFVWSYVRT